MGMTDREAFETWARELLGQGYSLYSEEGVYIHPVTRWAFKGFQAGRQQMAEAAAAFVEKNDFEGYEHEAARAIRSLATPTEGKT